MKVVILAGGKGTRLSEATTVVPKPMVEIGNQPILWHIMKIYSSFGFNDFIVCLGYKGYIIKEYFSHYLLHKSDVTIDLAQGKTIIHENKTESWRVTLVDTGLEALTAARLLAVRKYLGKHTFMMAYGDGLANINLKKLLDSHRKSKALSTVTAVQPLGRFGSLDIERNNKVKAFTEKPKGDNAWINAGFFVMEQGIFDYIHGDVLWEKEPVQALARAGKLSAYRHQGFWRPMDTLRDRNELERLWQSGNAPWKIWK
ncbi:MAG: glucose-1-phosphate cytidylyltransferase [Candidatus Omnitrophica bacterium]|jgi:glucose-1-phosphate cytidylyltransferase|nr:glucose-1-phosphate cytidylyltransferase [Candidatus Omnitrophota bacterium]